MTEYASYRRGYDALTLSLSAAHPDVVKSVNARRRKMGLPEVATRGNPLAPPPKLAKPLPAARAGRPCKTAKGARWAGLQLSAAVAVGRLRMNARR